MKRYRFFILCILSGLLRIDAAVPDGVRGTVTDAETGEPIVGAVIKTKGAFTASASDGKFFLRPKNGDDSVTFRSMGYAPLTLPLSEIGTDIRLSPKTTRLRDVIVQAPDIYAKGDTLVFNVGKYARKEDNAIIDVIKRLPGIKVEDDGTIKYQGKPISKFYIDGNDFIGGQYGLATDNISYEDVKSVEVMENHQPVKALEGIEFPEEAGINLTLKEDARSRWVGVAQAASGCSPLIYDGSVFAMRMAPKIQNMLTAKADNTGWNPASQIMEHDFDDMFFQSDYSSSLWPEYISADAVNAPLGEKRTRDNLSGLANMITAWKNGDTSMRLKLNYMADRLDYRSGMRTDYFSESVSAFVRNNALRTCRHDLSAQFNAEINKRGYYLKDKLTLGAVWDNSHSVVTGSSDLMQRVDRRSLSAANDLKLVKRNEKKVFSLTSRNTFSHRPDRLDIAGGYDAVQSIGTTDFRSMTEIQTGYLTRFWKYYLNAGLDLDYHRMNTSLSGLGEFDNAEIYNVFLSNLYAVPQVNYERNNWLLSLKASVKWLHQSLRGNRERFDLMPRIMARKKLTSKSELSGSLSYRLRSPQAYMIIDVPIMSDYRNIFRAIAPDRYTQDFAATLAYRYRNPLRALFMNMSATYNYSRSPVMPEEIFIDDFVVSTYARMLSHSNSWYVSGGLSKGLGHSRFVVGCDFDGSYSGASSMRNGEAVPYQKLAAGAGLSFRGSLTRWLSVDYTAKYGFSELEFENRRNSCHTVTQNLAATVTIVDNIHLNLGAEHYLTRFPEENVSGLVLLDASAAWQISGKTRLSVTANNLLDRRKYDYVSYGTLSRSEYTFMIRPRTILATLQLRF